MATEALAELPGETEKLAEPQVPAPRPALRLPPRNQGVTGWVIGGVVGGSAGGSVGGSVAHRRREEALPPGAKGGPAGGAAPDGNRFDAVAPNPFVSTASDALSTFAIDVDTASYTVTRRYLLQGTLPPPASIRVEEHLNYFRYAYPPPAEGAFAVHLDGAPSPFTPGHHLVRVGVQGKVVSKSQRKPAHVTFLVDTSGSMADDDRLPLAKEAIQIAIRNLNENDTIAIVTYAGEVRLALPPTPATQRARIHEALDTLQAGGGTAMGSGFSLAYQLAVRRAAGGVTSRVIVLTDGDTNLGPNLTADAMLESVGKYVREGVTLTMVGFGMGNYRDDLMERLANKGNGNCFYVDGVREARRIFEAQMAGTLEVIAKDVKVQVEFDPRSVLEYRLLGYENRAVADRDFRNDQVDAGEIGAGHSVTALYEVRLADAVAATFGTLRIRAKQPDGTVASEQAFALERSLLRPTLAAASADLRFAVAVAGIADLLRRDAAAPGASFAELVTLARGAAGADPERLDYVRLAERARALWEARQAVAGR